MLNISGLVTKNCAIATEAAKNNRKSRSLGQRKEGISMLVKKNAWQMPESCLILHPLRLTRKNVKYFATQDHVVKST